MSAKSLPPGWTAAQWSAYCVHYPNGGAHGDVERALEHIEVPGEYLANRGLYADCGMSAEEYRAELRLALQVKSVDMPTIIVSY